MLLQPEKDPSGFQDTFFNMVSEQVNALSSSFFALQTSDKEAISDFEADLLSLLNVKVEKLESYLEDQKQEEFVLHLIKAVEKKFSDQEKEVGREIWHQVVRSLFLSTFDQFWTQHLTAIDDLREGINLRGYAQMDPLVEYKNEAFILFEKLLSDIQFESIRRVMNVKVQKQEQAAQIQSQEGKETPHMHFHSASSINPFTGKAQASPEKANKEQATQPAQKKRKIGRNEPCWCGSGKKYKKCHYPN